MEVRKYLAHHMRTLLIVATATIACSPAALAIADSAIAQYEPLQEALPALPEELRLGAKYVPGTSTPYVRGYANKYDLHEWQQIHSGWRWLEPHRAKKIP